MLLEANSVSENLPKSMVQGFLGDGVRDFLACSKRFKAQKEKLKKQVLHPQPTQMTGSFGKEDLVWDPQPKIPDTHNAPLVTIRKNLNASRDP